MRWRRTRTCTCGVLTTSTRTATTGPLPTGWPTSCQARTARSAPSELRRRAQEASSPRPLHGGVTLWRVEVGFALAAVLLAVVRAELDDEVDQDREVDDERDDL